MFKRETEHLSVLQMKDLLMLTAARHLERPTSHLIEQGIFSQDFLEIGVEHCRQHTQERRKRPLDEAGRYSTSLSRVLVQKAQSSFLQKQSDGDLCTTMDLANV